MEEITIEEIADLLVNIGLDEGCDYDDETIQRPTRRLWGLVSSSERPTSFNQSRQGIC